MSVEERVAAHYRNDGLLGAIRDGLRALGKDPANATVEDLAPADHHHGGGLEATRRLAERLDRYAAIAPADRLIDLGSGIGGPARFFATAFGCRLTGIDLTPDFCHVAEALNEVTGLSERIDIHNGSVTDLPFDDAVFDHAYSQNVSMNIEDKAAFHGTVARVLKPGGCFALAEIVKGPGGDILFPNPFAKTPDHAFVVTLEQTIASLSAAGFEVLLVVNTADQSGKAHAERRDRAEAGELPPLGVHLIMGDAALEMVRNSAANTMEHRVIPYTFICRRR